MRGFAESVIRRLAYAYIRSPPFFHALTLAPGTNGKGLGANQRRNEQLRCTPTCSIQFGQTTRKNVAHGPYTIAV